MTVRGLVTRPSGLLPLALSLAALGTIVWFVAAHGVVRQPDEGLQAHLWQLLMAAQVALIASFSIRWVPVAPRSALVVLAIQVTAAIGLGLLPLWLLGGL